MGAGDLYDDLQPSTAVLKQSFTFLDDMRRIGRRVVFTQGQHEKAAPPYLSLHPYPTHAHRKAISMRGLTLYGLDHVPASRLEAEVEQIPPGVDVLLCHQVWQEFMGVGFEGSLEMLVRPGGPWVVLTGDYHDHVCLDVRGTRVFSPGSTCLQDITEPRRKAFFVLYDDLSVESVPLKTRRVHDVTIRVPEDLELVLADIERLVEPPIDLPPGMQKNIIYVQSAEVTEAFPRLTRAINGRAFLFWKSLVGSAGDTVYDERGVAQAIPRGLEGCLHLVTPEGGPTYNGVLRLLRAPDKKVELAAMAAEFGR